MTIKTKIIGTMLVGVALVSLVTFTFYYYQEKNCNLKHVDNELLKWARYAKATLPKDYHDRIVDGSSVLKEEYESIVYRNNYRCHEIGLRNLFSVLVIGPKTIVFTTATSPGYDIVRQSHAKFFELHKQPDMFSEAVKTMKPHYSYFHDEWGYSRILLLPQRDSKGRIFIFGASVDMVGIIAKQKRIVVTALLISLVLFLGGFLYSLFVTNMIARPINRISKAATNIATGNLDCAIEIGGIAELSALSAAMNCMRLNIKENISQIAKAKDKLLLLKDRQYNTLVENIPQKVFIKDRNSVYVLCNANYAADLKIKPNEIKGKTDYNFFPTHLAEKYRTDDKVVIESGKTENIEESYLVIDEFLNKSQEKFVNTVKVPIFDEGGNVTGLLGIFWDITAQKRAEVELEKYHSRLEEIIKEKTEQIQETEAKFRHIFDNSRDGILIADVNTKKFVICNKQMYTMLGMDCAADDIKCLCIDDIHPQESLPAVLELFEKIARKESNFAKDVPVKRKDGSVFYADITPSEMMLDGKRCLIGNFHDTTNRKKTEDDLQKALNIKSEFTGMVSHELRIPLAVIKEGVSVVLDKITGDVSEEQARYSGIVKNNVDRLDRLINEVLEFQVLESGRMEFNMKEEDMNSIVREVHSAMVLLSSKKGLSFNLNLCENLPRVRFDRDKMIEILTNLVNNALKYTQQGGITISTTMGNNFIQVVVKDTGIGIKEQDLPKVFKEFTRFDKRAGGTGLGLSICKKIITAHKGKIWVESPPIGGAGKFEKGTAFYFTLPIKERRA